MTARHLNRNHPELVNHIPEILLLWLANCESKVVQSYPQLINYVLKYTLKPEQKSATLQSIEKKLLETTDDDQVVRRFCQRMLMETVSQRDISVNEAFLILNKDEYVEYSRQFRFANLQGTRAIVEEAETDSDLATSKRSWAETYAERDSSPNFQKLCKDFESRIFKYRCNPRDISLRFYMSDFSMDWSYENSGFVPVINPTFRYTVPRDIDKPGSNQYKKYCRTVLLSEKPGCYLGNVGSIDDVHDQLTDFVKNSQHCPQLIREEFEESQKEGDLRDEHERRRKELRKNDGDDENSQDCEAQKDPEDDADRVFRDIFHDVEDLLLEEVMQGEIDEDAPLDDHQIFCGLKTRQRPEKPNENIEDQCYYDDEPADYDCKELLRDSKKVNWTTKMTTAEIKTAVTWLENKKEEVTIPETDYSNVDPSKLNQKQTLLYDMVTDWTLRKQADKNTKQFCLNLCGRAGCGKTFWLHSVSKSVKENIIAKGFLKKVAPTGKAAGPIDGTTIHSLLDVPVPIPKGKDLPELDDARLQTLQREFRNCELLIIDEKSMMGLEILNVIDQRLRQIKAEPTKPFGGISIIIMGDFGQLPPVGDKNLFGKDGLNNNQKKAALLYSLFTDVIFFDRIMRQLGDEEKMFRDFLTKLADGTLKEEGEEPSWKWLQSRDYASFSKEKQKEFKDTAIMLCARKKDLQEQNIYRFKALNTPIAPVKAENNNDTAKKCDAQKAGGLENTTILAVGAQMILTSNIWKEAGLTNGTLCEVREIVYSPGKEPTTALPDVVFVHVPDYKGPSYFPNEPKIVPITPIRRQWHKGKTLCVRRMIPLLPAYALTIHKSQGMSLEKILVNLGLSEFSLGLSYTALSRCIKLLNLALDPFPTWERFQKMFESPSFKKRLQEEARLRDLEAQTIARGYLG